LAIKHEQYGALYDYLKHLGTLSTGSILLITGFLEKLFKQPEWKVLVGVSLVGFMLTVVFSVIVHSITVAEHGLFYDEDSKNIPTWVGWLSLVILGLLWLSFLTAIVSFTVFSLKNLY
jgi:hypothetical protein